MNRKKFIKGLLATAGSTLLVNQLLAGTDPSLRGLVPQPPLLLPGDIIGITCPANPMELKEMLNTQRLLQMWGFKICVGNTVGQQWERFGGSDAERTADLQLMLNDPSIKAILFARGGYGAMRIVDRVDWSAFQQSPKWLVGFSDMTAIHCHVHTLFGIPTLHAEMASGFKQQETISTRSIRYLLSGNRIEYTAPAFGQNRKGTAQGILVGGNLSLICAMLGSKSELQTEGKILFIEEVNEFKYTLDRMMMSLKRSGKLSNLAGLIIGGVTATRADNEMTFPMSVEEIISEKVQEYNYPICFGFPAGHVPNNYALKLGVPHHLQIESTGSFLREIIAPSVVPPVQPIEDSTNNNLMFGHLPVNG